MLESTEGIGGDINTTHGDLHFDIGEGRLAMIEIEIKDGKVTIAGKSNYGTLRQEFADKLHAMSDAEYLVKAKDTIWLSAYANNNPRSDYHWQADVCYSDAALDSIIVGAYWFLADYHGGQNSLEYRVLSRLGEVYKPGCESGPQKESSEMDVYESLEGSDDGEAQN